MALLLGLILLLGPDTSRRWSKSHAIGVWIPKEWKILSRDEGIKAFVVDGPQLGPGKPRMVLTTAGGTAASTLTEIADRLAAQVAKRPGWQVVARVPKRIGPWPCIRIGIRFLENGAKGRARFTVVSMGDRYYVLELSAASSHFPGATFDRIERSLAVRWRKMKIGEAEVEVPAGWFAEVQEGLLVEAPAPARCVMFVAKRPRIEDEGKPGPKVTLLGKRRESTKQERRIGDMTVRRLIVNAEGWNADVMMPVSLWEDYFPVMEEILKRLRAPSK